MSNDRQGSEGENFEEADHVLLTIREPAVGVPRRDSSPARHVAETRLDCAVQTENLTLPLPAIRDIVTFHRHNVLTSGDCEAVSDCNIQIPNLESAPQPPTYSETMDLERQNARTPSRRSPLFDNCPDCCFDICEIKNKVVLFILFLGLIGNMCLILYELNSPTVDPMITKGLRIFSLLTYTVIFLYHAVIYQFQNKKMPSHFLYGITCLCALLTIYVVADQ